MANHNLERLLKLAEKRGRVTYSELNAVLPSDQHSATEIEDLYARLADLGIQVVEDD